MPDKLSTTGKSHKSREVMVLCACPCCEQTLRIRIEVLKEEVQVSSGNKSPGKRKAASLKAEEVPIPERIRSEKFQSAWNGFIEMRRSIKKPMTGRAAQLLLNRFVDGEFRAVPPELAVKIVDQSTEMGWQGLFPLKLPGTASAPRGQVVSLGALRMEVENIRKQRRQISMEHYQKEDSYHGGKPLLKGWKNETARAEYAALTATMKELEKRISSMLHSA